MSAEPDISHCGCATETPSRWTFDDFQVVLSPPTTAHETDNSLTIPAHTCWMIMSLQGEMHLRVTGSETPDGGELCLSPDNCLLQYAPQSCACSRRICEQKVQLLEISCPADSLQQLVGDSPLGRELQQAMSGQQPLHIHRPMSPAVRQSLRDLHQAITSARPGSGALVISRALEMVWHFTHSGGRNVSARIPADALRALDKAKGILEENLETPPDLETLAGMIGMSLTRLKLLFPQVYGMPPFALLRQLRMERARHLLRVEKRSVTDVALEVGYSNISHFSKIFMEHFGIKPSQVRRGLDTPSEPETGRAFDRNTRL